MFGGGHGVVRLMSNEELDALESKLMVGSISAYLAVFSRPGD